MRIERRIEANLQEQLEHYENLLGFAEQKAEILKKSADRGNLAPLRNIVTKEVQIVSALNELEKQRLSLLGTSKLETVIEHSDEPEQKKELCSLKARIKKVMKDLEEKNTHNRLMLEVSLKIIGRVLSAVKDLSSPQKSTYSRIRKPGAVQNRSFQALNIKV
jgi:flagellar biosynthesis/type III secretory pathway chaperone